MKRTPGIGELASAYPYLWQGDSVRTEEPAISTGFPILDGSLPAAGWPGEALIEITVPYWGVGELRLLLPAMLRLNQQKRRIVWIAPPYLPYAPALANAGLDLTYVLVVDAQTGNISWAMEQVLCTEACGMVLAWPHHLSTVEARRLQLAAKSGRTAGFVIRTPGSRWQATSAALRLRMHTTSDRTEVEIIKARGGCRRSRARVEL